MCCSIKGINATMQTFQVKVQHCLYKRFGIKMHFKYYIKIADPQAHNLFPHVLSSYIGHLRYNILYTTVFMIML